MATNESKQLNQVNLHYGPETSEGIRNKFPLLKSENLMAMKLKPNKSLSDLIKKDGYINERYTSFFNYKGSLDDFHLMEFTGSNVKNKLTLLNALIDEVRNKEHDEIDICTHVFHSSNDGVAFIPSGLIYIKLQPAITDEEKGSLLQKYHLLNENEEDHPWIKEIPNAIVVRTSEKSENPMKVVMKIQDEEKQLVLHAEPDLMSPIEHCKQNEATTDGREVEDLIEKQWYLDEINAKGASGFSTPNVKTTVIVAIIDDGCDMAHPELAQQSVDGFDFITNKTVKALSTPDGFVGKHGTACAGIIAALDNNKGICGIAPKCRFMPIKSGNTASFKTLSWFKYALDNKADIISCAWEPRAKNFPLSDAASEVIKSCVTGGRDHKGCIICFSAGNITPSSVAGAAEAINGFITHPGIITVSGITKFGKKSPHCKTSEFVWVVAPTDSSGNSIVTLAPKGTGVRFEKDSSGRIIAVPGGDFNKDFGGTSASVSIVSGVCARILAENPNLTFQEVKEILKDSATKIPGATFDSNGKNTHFGYGLVNLQAALQLAKKAATPTIQNRRV
jgi:Subtilase family